MQELGEGGTGSPIRGIPRNGRSMVSPGARSPSPPRVPAGPHVVFVFQLPVEDDIDLSDVELDDLERDEL